MHVFMLIVDKLRKDFIRGRLEIQLTIFLSFKIRGTTKEMPHDDNGRKRARKKISLVCIWLRSVSTMHFATEHLL